MGTLRIPLRKLNDAIRITLPPFVKRELEIRPGDYADVTWDHEGFQGRWVRVEPPTEMEPA
jgi:hypothetical protein